MTPFFFFLVGGTLLMGLVAYIMTRPGLGSKQ